VVALSIAAVLAAAISHRCSVSCCILICGCLVCGHLVVTAMSVATNMSVPALLSTSD